MIKSKLLFLVFIFIFPLCNATGYQKELETHSVFYGLVTLAAKNPKTSICFDELAQTRKSFDDGIRWALKMFDASGTPASGIHWGNTYWLGSMKQCEANMQIKKYGQSPLLGAITIEPPESIPPFPVNYFGSYFIHKSDVQVITHMDNEFRITLGMCLPSSCTETEITELLQKYFDSKKLYIQRLYNTTLTMENSRKITYDTTWLQESSTIILGSIFCILIILGIFGTIYDVAVHQPRMALQNTDQNKQDVDERIELKSADVNTNLWQKLLISFSAYTNNKLIFDTTESPNSIKCIHGMKVLGMIILIVGHTVLFLMYFYDNRVFVYFVPDLLISQIFADTHYATDGFFCMSGYLLTYSYFKNGKHKIASGIKKKFIMLFNIFIKRLFRLVPSYIFSILFTITITTWRTRSTVFWINEKDEINCKNYWWRNILFINNFYPRSEMCQAWSWYLSNDMQLYLIISFILFVASTHFKAAVKMLVFIFASCFVYTTYATYIYQYIPVLDVSWSSFYMKIFYDRPWSRINCYILGTVAGYIVYKFNKTLPVKRFVVWLLWITFICITLVMLFAFGDYNMSVYTSMVYTPLSRVLWSFNAAWIIVACETGNGGIMNYILTLKVWIPLSRLTFMAFFLNPLVILFFASYNERPLHVDFHMNAILSFGFLFMSYAISYMLVLLLEIPLTKFINTLMNHRNKMPLPEATMVQNKSDKNVALIDGDKQKVS